MQFYFFAILLAKAQLNSILKDVVELSFLSIWRKTPPLPPKKKEEETSKGKKEKKLLTRKKDELGF